MVPGSLHKMEEEGFRFDGEDARSQMLSFRWDFSAIPRCAQRRCVRESELVDSFGLMFFLFFLFFRQIFFINSPMSPQNMAHSTGHGTATYRKYI